MHFKNGIAKGGGGTIFRGNYFAGGGGKVSIHHFSDPPSPPGRNKRSVPY